MAAINVSGTERRKQETGAGLLTNGMFLKGNKDNNLLQLYASIPEDHGRKRREG